MTWWRKRSVRGVALALAASMLIVPVTGNAYKVPERPGPLPVDKGDPEQPPAKASALHRSAQWLVIVVLPGGAMTLHVPMPSILMRTYTPR